MAGTGDCDRVATPALGSMGDCAPGRRDGRLRSGRRECDCPDRSPRGRNRVAATTAIGSPRRTTAIGSPRGSATGTLCGQRARDAVRGRRSAPAAHSGAPSLRRQALLLFTQQGSATSGAVFLRKARPLAAVPAELEPWRWPRRTTASVRSLHTCAVACGEPDPHEGEMLTHRRGEHFLVDVAGRGRHGARPRPTWDHPARRTPEAERDPRGAIEPAAQRKPGVAT